MEMRNKSSALKADKLFLSPKEYFSEVVGEGLAKRKVHTSPSVHIYLVSLLEYYLDAKNLFAEEVDAKGNRKYPTLAEMYLQATSADSVERVERLKKLGDRTLYISGFFGDSLERKLIDVDYYVEMGGAAYSSLAKSVREQELSNIYRTFSERFLDFVDVLTYISESSFVQSDSSILRLYDKYLRTGSELAREKLLEMGVMTVPKNIIKFPGQN